MLESDFWNLVFRYISLKNLSKLQIIKNPEKVVIKHIDSIGKDIYLLNFQLPNIIILNLSYRNLKKIPCLPKNLIKLWCPGNQLQNLPCLPSGLKELWCSGNKLQTLPYLPDGLKVLWCYHNQLQTLSDLPSGLEYLWCFNNQIQTLPCLPNTLVKLRVSHNISNCIKHMEIPERCLIEYV